MPSLSVENLEENILDVSVNLSSIVIGLKVNYFSSSAQDMTILDLAKVGFPKEDIHNLENAHEGKEDIDLFRGGRNMDKVMLSMGNRSLR